MGKIPGDWQQLTTDDFGLAFLHTLKHGQVLGFKQEDGSMKHWRVCRVNTKAGTWWIQPWELYESIEQANNARKGAA